MRCIILAAGEGIRMRPLTLEIPKPMVKVCGRPLLEHIIGALPKEIDETILVVGYLHDKIRDYFGESFGRFKLRYVFQENKLGTYHALKLCEHLLSPGERFLLMYADDLHGHKALSQCVKSDKPCLVVGESETPSRFGVVELANDGRVVSLEEKPENPKTNLVLTGAQLLTRDIINFPPRRYPNGEYYLTDSIAQMIKAGYEVYSVRTDFWWPVGYPEDIQKAEKALLTWQNKN